MNRRLLPYERGLCQQLQLSEEEYLLFLAAQHDYSLSQAQRLETLRGEPVSIALAVVGIVAQVASALLAPKPQAAAEAPVQRRDRRFAPRYGFNSTQELAQYGEPINLIYCNQAINPHGAVRANTSLLWSSVESTGTGQYMQLLLLVGAAGVRRLDLGKTAFGQLPAKQFAASNTWMYYSEQRGPVRFSQKVWGDKRDPAMEDAGTGDIVHRLRNGSSLREGYSMAFSPSSMKDLGVYAPIPINVEIYERGPTGNLHAHNIGIHMNGQSWGDGHYEVGEKVRMHFDKADREQGWYAGEAAKDLRLQLVGNIDRGATYQLGSAQFKVNWVDDDISLDTGEVGVGLECIERGRKPSTPYGRLKPKEMVGVNKEEFEHYLKVLEAPATTTVSDLSLEDAARAGFDMRNAQSHQMHLGMTDNQKAARQAKNSLATDNIYIKGLGREYDFNGTVTLNWTNDLDKPSSVTYPEGGSLAYSQLVLEQFLADKPKLPTKALRREYASDLRQLRRYRDDLKAGRYKNAIRNDIKRSDPTVNSIWNQIRNLNNLIAAATGEDMDEVWREEAKATGTVQSLRSQILSIREQIESYADNEQGGSVAKKVKRLENQIEDIRSTRREWIDNYVGRKRRESKTSKSQVRAWRDQKDDLRTSMREMIDDRMDDWRANKTQEAREANYPFIGYDGNRYACGVNCLLEKIDDLKGEWTTDQIGVDLIRKALRELIKKKQEALQWLRWLMKNWETLARDGDDHFYSKCLAKMSEAGYQTVTACDQVRFNFRVRLFRRISGRQLKYGEREAPDGYKLSDNGIKRRTMFFYVMFRDVDAPAWQMADRLFAVERGQDADHYITLLFSSPRKVKREFKFVPVLDANASIKEHGFTKYAYIYNAGKVKTVAAGDGTLSFFGKSVDLDYNNLPALKERGPMYTNEWDMFSVHSDTQVQSSCDSGPEASLVNVTEQISCPLDAQKYKDMSLLAFHTYASNGVEDLRSISAYVLEGKAAWKVNEATGAPFWSGAGISFAPDIFTDTVMDATNGIKNFANSNAIDWDQLALAKRFCKNNGLGCQLFMEGVIADRRGWRDFWAEVAPYSLLEFARLNGKETLIPSLPCTSDGVATTNLTVSALFNEGNIIEDSYKEDYMDYGDNTKDLVATVIYREMLDAEVFPRNASVTLCRNDADVADAVWQTFDLSDWVSQKRQAVLFARMLCQQRRYVGRTVEFRTVPTDSPIRPGAYIYVDIGLKRWDSVRTGVVKAGGVLDLPLDVGVADGTYTVMTYDSQHDPAVSNAVAVQDGVATALASKVGSLFVMGSSNDARRVFRVTEVSLDESAEITVRASEHPCRINGATVTSLVADLSDGLFKEIGVDCT
jgi:hypothetical protein